MAENNTKKEGDTQEKKPRSSTSLRWSDPDYLDRYKQHAKDEGLSFKKLVMAFFELDIKQSKECLNDPEKIMERIKVKRDRCDILGETKREAFNIDHLLEAYEKLKKEKDDE